MGVLLETYGFCGNTCDRIEWITQARIIYSRRRTAAGISMSTTEGSTSLTPLMQHPTASFTGPPHDSVPQIPRFMTRRSGWGYMSPDGSLSDPRSLHESRIQTCFPRSSDIIMDSSPDQQGSALDQNPGSCIGGDSMAICLEFPSWRLPRGKQTDVAVQRDPTLP